MVTAQTDQALATTTPAQPAPPLSPSDRTILAAYLGHRLRPKALGESTAQPAAIEAWARSPQIAPHIAGFYFINALASHSIHTGNYIDAQLAVSREFAKASSSSQRYTALNAYIRLCNATRSHAPKSPFQRQDPSAKAPTRARSRRNQLADAARALTTDYDDSTSFNDPQSPSFDDPSDPTPIHRHGDSTLHHDGDSPQHRNSASAHHLNGNTAHHRNGDTTSSPALPELPSTPAPSSSCSSRPSRSTSPPGQNTPAPSISSSSLPPSGAKTPAANLPSPRTSTPTESPSSSSDPSIPPSSLPSPVHTTAARRLTELSGAAQAGAWP